MHHPQMGKTVKGFNFSQPLNKNSNTKNLNFLFPFPHFLSNQTETKPKAFSEFREITNLEGLSEPLSLAKIVNDSLKLGDSELVPIVYPIIELWYHACLRISEGTDFGVQARLVGSSSTSVVGSSCNRNLD